MCSRANSERRRGFTLLEVIIATMIIGMLAVTLFHLVSANLRAIRYSTELSDERDALRAAVRLLEVQLRELPFDQAEALSGKPLKFRGVSNDEITWRSRAGAGLLTTAASGEYRVTLTVQPVSEKASETELGLRRQLIDPTRAVEAAPLTPGAAAGKYDWLPLVRPMAALEIRYFNQKLNAWQDTWNDPVLRPTLVRVRMWKEANTPPIEALLPVPSARAQR